MAIYQVTIGDRVMRVELRTDGERTFARANGAEERVVGLTTVRGALRSLGVDETRSELLAHRADETVQVVLQGIQYEVDVVDELHARLAQLAGSTSATHTRRELKAPMPGLIVRVTRT